MKQEDLKYLREWEAKGCFKPAGIAQVFRGLIEGIWVLNPKDPEDCYVEHPHLIRDFTESEYCCKEFGMCPVMFRFENRHYGEKGEDNDHKYKLREISSFGRTWWLDKYEARKFVTQWGLELAKEFDIKKEEIEELVKANGFKDEVSFEQLLWKRPELARENTTKIGLWLMGFKYIRAAFCPNTDHFYNWMDHPEKAGIILPEKEIEI